jgi:hypothetical protein
MLVPCTLEIFVNTSRGGELLLPTSLYSYSLDFHVVISHFEYNIIGTDINCQLMKYFRAIKHVSI